MSGYVPISKAEMDQLMVSEMGFYPVPMPTGEYVYDRDVITTSGVEYPYVIRVFSSVLKRNGMSEEVGSDSIKVVLMDRQTGLPVKKAGRRVHRTKNALPNLRKRCREEFRSVLESPKCPKCSSMMVRRKNGKTGHEFYGCTRYTAPETNDRCTTTVKLP